MKTSYVSFFVVAVVTISTLLACSITQISSSKSNSPLATPTSVGNAESQKPTDEGSQASQEPTATSIEESQEPIVGTWKQIAFQGLQGSSNTGLAGYAWFGDYFYAGTQITLAVTQPARPGPIQAPQPSGAGSSGAGQAPSDQGPVSSSGGVAPSGAAAQPPAGPRGAEIWRTLNGTDWEVIGEPGLGYPDITVFRPTLFQERIYVFPGTKPALLVSKDGMNFEMVAGEWADGDITYMLQNNIIKDALFVRGAGTQKGLQAWLSSDGEGFDAVIKDSLGDMRNISMCGNTAESLQGWYYMGVMNVDKGAELWRTKDGRVWENSFKAGYDDPSHVMLCSSIIHNGYLYVTMYGNYGNGSKLGVEVIRTADGDNWEKVITNGFGLGEEQGYTGGLTMYKEALYFMLNNLSSFSRDAASTGFRLWKSLDGKTWEQVGEPGFGNPNNESVNALVSRGVLYLATHNIKEGNQVWRSSDGTNWELFNTFPASETNNADFLVELADGIEYFEYDSMRGIQIWRYGP